MASIKKHTYLKTHTISGRVLRIDLTAEDARLHAQAATSKSGRAAKTLVKEGPIRVTQVALRKGTSLQTHRVEGAVSLHVQRGRLRLTLGDETMDLGVRELAVLDVGVEHAATALSDCALVITTAMG